MNAALPAAHRQIQVAADALARTKTALRAVPAKIAATELDPNAKRARPRLARRGLQMVLRLLAFNAEAWLADRFNAYLTDPDEYRAITRHLLHLGGQVDNTAKKITITLDRPDSSPRVARALGLLAEELNATPACLPGPHANAPWYTTKTEPSYADMHAALRRAIIAARFSPTSPEAPSDDEIRAVLTAWATAEPARAA